MRTDITSITKTINGNGTFTYSDNTGSIIIANSKRNYEYWAPTCINAKGLVFGSYKTCLQGIYELQKRMNLNLEYCIKNRTKRSEKYGVEEAEKGIKEAHELVALANTAVVRKIEEN